MHATPTDSRPNPYATYAPQLGAELWRLAARWSKRGMRERPDTQSARVDAIRQLRPDLSRARAVEMDRIIWRAIEYICAARSPMYRAGRRHFARYGKGMTMAVWQRARDTKRPADMPKPARDWRVPLDMSHPMAQARFVRRERYAWPGGYALALVTSDGALLCPDCVAENFHWVSEDTRRHRGTGWKPMGITGAHESDESAMCDHCSRTIWECEE